MRTVALRQSTDLKAGCIGHCTVVKVQWIRSASGPHSHWPADSPLLWCWTTTIQHLKRGVLTGETHQADPTATALECSVRQPVLFCATFGHSQCTQGYTLAVRGGRAEKPAHYFARSLKMIAVYSRLYPCCNLLRWHSKASGIRILEFSATQRLSLIHI